MLVLQVAPERARSCYQRATLANKGSKRLDLLRREIVSSTGFQLCVTNYQALLAKYDFNIYFRLVDFTDKLSTEVRAQFQSPVAEGKLVA